MSKLRWNCKERKKCFVEYKHVKLELFDDLFEYGIECSDVDAIVEVGGHFLLQEWKDPEHDSVPKDSGQRIMFNQMTKNNRFTVVIVFGDAKEMTVDRIEIIKGGESLGITQCTFERLREKVKIWADSHYKDRFK